MKRYFISNYKKNRTSADGLLGKPECIICKNDLVLDIHHIRTDKKVVFLCPNHHNMIHRFIFTSAKSANFVRDEPYSLKQLLTKIKNIERKNKPYYEVGEIYKRKEDWMERNMIKHADRYSWLKDLNEKGKEEYLNTEVVYFCGRRMEKNKLVSLEPKCFICKYYLILDIHHNHKDDKIISLCPNHHSIIHRHLEDGNGKKYKLNQIIDKIKKIEETKLPYYTEISGEQYLKDYKKYKITVIKTPYICKSCNQWFYPKKERKDICFYCYYEKIKTSFNKLFELVHKHKKIKMNDVLAHNLGITMAEIESREMFLGWNNLELHYPAIGEPEIRKKGFIESKE